MKYQNVFAKSKYDLGRTTIVQHEIDTGDHRPIKQAPRRMPLNKKKDSPKGGPEYDGIIEPSVSPGVAPLSW